MPNYSSIPFIKVVVLQIDPIYSTEVIDEHHFGIDDKDKIESFKESYSSPIYYCVEIEMGGIEC